MLTATGIVRDQLKIVRQDCFVDFLNPDNFRVISSPGAVVLRRWESLGSPRHMLSMINVVNAAG